MSASLSVTWSQLSQHRHNGLESFKSDNNLNSHLSGLIVSLQTAEYCIKVVILQKLNVTLIGCHYARCTRVSRLSGEKGGETDGRKLECKLISVEKEKQPVGMFP